MILKSKPMSEHELNALRAKLAWPVNDPDPALGGKRGRVLDITDIDSKARVVTLSFDDERGINLDFLKQILADIGMIHCFSFPDATPSARLQKVEAGFRGAGAIANLADGTYYTMETDSTSRWCILVQHMPTRRFVALLSVLDGIHLLGRPYAELSRIESSTGQVPIRFGFALNIRHNHSSHPDSPDDERYRAALCEVLNLELEWASEPVPAAT